MDGNSFLLQRSARLWCSDGQNAVGGQVRLNLVDVVALWQDILPDEVTGNVAVLVLFLLMFALNLDGVVAFGCYGDFIGREVLDIQVDL